VPKRQDIDQELRRRLVSWLEFYRDTWFHGSQARLAEKLGVAEGTISGYFGKQQRTPGLDLVYRMHVALGADVNMMFRQEPDRRREPPPPLAGDQVSVSPVSRRERLRR
jgi:transcriptional regulator with XRE-family HTH domain